MYTRLHLLCCIRCFCLKIVQTRIVLVTFLHFLGDITCVAVVEGVRDWQAACDGGESGTNCQEVPQHGSLRNSDEDLRQRKSVTVTRCCGSECRDNVE
jgi:hypothetical protein